MASKVKVSIIIPVYNTEKFLSRCLDSLLKQTLHDLEIIIINDQTPDNSMQIATEFAKKIVVSEFLKILRIWDQCGQEEKDIVGLWENISFL